MQVKIEKPTKEKLKELNVFAWPVWEKEVSEFDWYYDDKETCYLLEGNVTVTSKDGESVCFGAGDLVVFPKGLSCAWNIRKAVRKHYKFG